MARMAADVAGGFTEGFDLVGVALAAQRSRVVDLVDSLSGDDWGQQSRCELWTVHDVVRHVRDACRLHVQGLRGDGDSPFDEPFDNRQTPLRWLERTAGETPQETVDDLRALSAMEATALAAGWPERLGEVVKGPYGPVHRTVLTTHVLWDAWLHERDITEPLGLVQRSTPVEDCVVSAYALLIASLAAVLAGHVFEATVALAGGSDHTYVATVGPGRVALHDGPASCPADLRGDVGRVVDALAGRGDEVASVLSGDSEVRVPFTWLRPMLRPVPVGE